MAILQTVDVTVRFGGNLAVNGVNLSVDEGSITGLIGPNGAGKTTTFNVITGLQRPTRGEVLFDGEDVTAAAPHARARLGIARTFQRLEVFGSLTVADNVLVAAEAHQRGSMAPAEAANVLLRRVGIHDLAGERADSLSTGNARLVELARAMACRPRVLLLDEPASGLDEEETERFAETLIELAEDGLAILIVEHDVPLVMRLCSQITVLNFGEVLAQGTPAEIQQDARVIDAYLGQGTDAGAIDA
jgi:branched-chain amino acid transport system ATP-binding protein